MLCALRTDKHVCSTFHNLSLFNKERRDCCSPTACLVISSHRSDLYCPFPRLSVSCQYFTHILTSTASSNYLEVYSIFTRVQTGDVDTYLQRHPYAYTFFKMAPSPIDYTDFHGGTHVRIFSHTFFKKQTFKLFWALSEGPRGSTPASSNPSPRATYPRIFSRLSTSILTKGFTQALPTSTATPTPPSSLDPASRFTYPTIFSRLSTSILTKGFT